MAGQINQVMSSLFPGGINLQSLPLQMFINMNAMLRYSNSQTQKLWKFYFEFIWTWKLSFPPYLREKEHKRRDSTTRVNIFKIQMDIGLWFVYLYIFFQSFKCSWCMQASASDCYIKDIIPSKFWRLRLSNAFPAAEQHPFVLLIGI